ncbi:MAG TPA: hypothetical protein VD995_24250 [Azospirillum sp.]|nr:hypothetical protein [Azospirillum sp.]
MTLDVSQRIDDLTPDQAATVVRAYENALDHEDHDDAFALAMGVFRTFRPELPLSIVASELELLLACTPKTGTAHASYG